MHDDVDIGPDHCRVVPPTRGDDMLQRLQYMRHLFAYVRATRFVPAHARVLEIGAGEGYGANHLAPHVSHLVATDLSAKSCAHAASAYKGIPCCVALATDLPFAAGAFDAVVAFQVVEHIQDVDRCVREISRVLAPSGLLLLTTPNRKLRLLPLQKPWNPYHVREYSAAQLRRTMRRFFANVQLYGVTARPDILRLEKARVAQSPLRLCYHAVQRRLAGGLPRRLLQALANQVLLVRRQHQPLRQQVPLRSVELQDFFLTPDADAAMDLFVVASRMPQRSAEYGMA